MGKIYIITSGSYSDYNIQAVFSVEGLAQKAIDSGFVYGDIEEFELDPVINTYPLLEKGWRIWVVNFDRTGNIQRMQEHNKAVSYGYLAEMEGCCKWIVRSAPDFIEVYLLARGKEHAIKSANEKRIMVMVNPKLWNPDYYHNNENFQVKHFDDITKW